METEISVHDEQQGSEVLTVDALVTMAPVHFSLEERVPGVTGNAFDLKSWYRAWAGEQQREPTHMTVEAADEFQAAIPWGQLDRAALLFAEEDGLPLKKGFPLRLYVPGGSSECLNVKSVKKIYFRYNEQLGADAEFGFKNTVSMDDMKKR